MTACTSTKKDRWNTLFECARGEHPDGMHESVEGLMWTNDPWIDTDTVIAAAQYDGLDATNIAELPGVTLYSGTMKGLHYAAIHILAAAPTVDRRPRLRAVHTNEWVVVYSTGDVFVLPPDRFAAGYRANPHARPEKLIEEPAG